MAKIKYSALVSDMRNKLNGSVMSKNRYGSYVRNKVTPVNPQTAYQQEVRQRLGSLSQSWRELTVAQRNGWTERAKESPFTDIFGDTKTLDGKAFFIKLNSNLLSIGEQPISVAPQMVEMPTFSIIGQSASVAGGITFTTDISAAPAGFEFKVFATPALPAQINFVKNRYRDLGTAEVADGDALITTAYGRRFGALDSSQLGNRVHIKVVLVSTTTGQMSVAVGSDTSVVA